jgi:hypothetical protein
MIPTFTPPKPFQSFSPIVPVAAPQEPVQKEKPAEAQLPRIVQYGADTSGCGLYRLGWVNHLLNYQGKAMVCDSTVMVTDPRFYHNVKSIRLQRQALTAQKDFVKFLKSIQKDCGFKLIYEVDDVVFREDIPDYNKFKSAFVSDEIRNNIVEIINLCDEVSVTCDFMKELYQMRTGKKEITVIPNFPAKFWIGNYYNQERITSLYEKNKKKPRILYAGSGAHFDVENRVGQKDDFEHVLKSIIDSRKKYQWVFMGAFPLALRPYIENGDIEFHPWQRLYNYPEKIHDLGVQMTVAPLQDNAFNKAKSDLKYIEACAYGLPAACQNICTYEHAEIKFNNGDQMLDCIEKEMKSGWDYKKNAPKRRAIAEDRFLELDRNLACYEELFLTPFGDPSRVNLARYNKV